MSSDGEEGKRRGGARWMAQSVACTIRRSDAATPILWIAPIRAARCATRAAVDRRAQAGRRQPADMANSLTNTQFESLMCLQCPNLVQESQLKLLIQFFKPKCWMLNCSF